MKQLTLVLSAAAIALGGVAYAQTGAPQGGDRDAPETWAQYQARAAAAFDRMDANHDGVINEADRQAMRAARQGQAFDRMDANHDGTISRDEYAAAQAGGARGAGDHDSDHGAMGPGGHGHGGHHGPHGGMEFMMLLRSADANHDGQITRAEFDAAAKAHFAAVDTNHDGVLSKEERQAFHKKMRAEMEARWQTHGGAPGDRPGGDGAMDGPPPPPPGE